MRGTWYSNWLYSWHVVGALQLLYCLSPPAIPSHALPAPPSSAASLTAAVSCLLLLPLLPS